MAEGRVRVVREKQIVWVRCCPFLLVILIFFLISPRHSSAVTFTNAVTISETNLTYDGQDVIVDGATVTIDGPHSFNSVLLTNSAVSTNSRIHVNRKDSGYKFKAHADLRKMPIFSQYPLQFQFLHDRH